MRISLLFLTSRTFDHRTNAVPRREGAGGARLVVVGLKKAKARRGGCCGTSEQAIEKLEARLAKLRLIKEDRNTFEVVVSPGGHAGDLLQITDPMGRVVTATVPEGLREGEKFSLPYVKQVPVAQGVVVARATPAAGGEGEPSEAKQGG